MQIWRRGEEAWFDCSGRYPCLWMLCLWHGRQGPQALWKELVNYAIGGIVAHGVIFGEDVVCVLFVDNLKAV